MKLTYFDARARSEPARLLLALAGVPHDYVAVPLGSWRGPEGKARFLELTPFGQLPMLEDGDLRICQSGAINRHLARTLGFYGDTPAESARVDEVYETAQELFLDIALFHWNRAFHDERPKHRETMRLKLAQLEAWFVRTRADEASWVLPGRYTLGDVLMAYVVESVQPLHPGLVEEVPELGAFMRRFFAADGVREYVRGPERPRTFTVPIAAFGGRPEETHHFAD